MMKWNKIFFILCLIIIVIFPVSSYAKDFKNSLGINMLYIEGGDFMMGNHNDEGGSDEKPVHKVNIDPFFLSDTTITVAQWKEFCNAGDTEWNRWEDVKKYSPSDDYPIVYVSWADAVDFCKWLSEKENKKYRLLTEAEWEFAARGGLSGKLYPWGNTPVDGSLCNFADKNEYLKEKDLWASEINIDDKYAYCAKTKDYPPNGYGLYQMAGNVLEWCSDWYYSNYYKETPVDNPKGPLTGRERVLRGGAWCFPISMLRTSKRYALGAKIRKEFVGFRIAISQN